jgi:hypothetical protein
MGVTLSLDGGRRQAKPRRRGQHTRTAEEQACMDAFAALLRSDAAGAARFLSRVTKGTLGSRVLPAAKSLAEAADLMLAVQPEPRHVEIDLSLSAACLTGQRRPAACELCLSPTCQHDCHVDRFRTCQTTRAAQP